MLAILFQEKTKKKRLVFPKSAEKNASIIEKGLGVTGFSRQQNVISKI